MAHKPIGRDSQISFNHSCISFSVTTVINDCVFTFQCTARRAIYHALQYVDTTGSIRKPISNVPPRTLFRPLDLCCTTEHYMLRNMYCISPGCHSHLLHVIPHVPPLKIHGVPNGPIDKFAPLSHANVMHPNSSLICGIMTADASL